MAIAEEIEAPAAEVVFADLVRSNLRRNYLAHLGHGIFGQTGFRLINAPTFVPAYIYSLSGSELVVGVARAVQALGQCLSPLFSATLIEHRRKVLPIGMRIGTLLRVQVLGHRARRLLPAASSRNLIDGLRVPRAVRLLHGHAGRDLQRADGQGDSDRRCAAGSRVCATRWRV